MAVVKAAPRDARVTHWRPDVDTATGITRRRYRGQGRRGHTPAVVTDARDVLFAIGELRVAHVELVRCGDINDRRERDRQRRTAHEKVALANRMLDELLERGVL